MCAMKCPICGEMLQKYGEIDPDAGTSIVLGANCSKCGIGDSDIKLWQELIRTKKQLVTKCNQLKIAVDALKRIDKRRRENLPKKQAEGVLKVLDLITRGGI